MMDGDLSNKLNQDLAYDLRQKYAKIVGDHLEDISDARKQNNFYLWFKNLEDLHTVIKFKFKDKKEKYKELDLTPEEIYKKIVKEIVDLSNTYKQIWVGEVRSGEGYAFIENRLRELEEFLYDKMNEAKMFGSGGRVEGL